MPGRPDKMNLAPTTSPIPTIDETQKNEVRRFRREIGETFGQSVLEVRRADLAHTIRPGSNPNR